MLKELLGNKNPSKEKEKEKSVEKKQKNRRINSVLNNFDLFKKINTKKRLIQKEGKVNNFKLIQKNENNKKIIQKQINSKSSYSRNNNNFIINSSCSIRRNIDKLNSISNFKSFNFDASEYQSLLKKKDLMSNYSLYNSNIKEKENQSGNQNLYENNNNIYLNSVKNANEFFINNLDQEFEIRSLKKKLKNLKNKNKSLNQQLDNIKEKNDIIKIEMIGEQNKRKDIICSFINICNDIFNNEGEVEDGANRFKNILLNLMDLKYRYENIIMENEFISNIGTLLSLTDIFSDNFYDNKRNNSINNIYHHIKNLIKLKTNYLNNIKKYKLLLIKNKKYFNYCSDLLKKFNLNDLDNLYNYLKTIKSLNEKENRKLKRMKNVLFNSINHNKRRNINKSVDNFKNPKKCPINFNSNFNYSDLQRYFNEYNNNKKYLKERYFTIKTEKSEYIDSLTDREMEKVEERNNEDDKSSTKKINYFLSGNIKYFKKIYKNGKNHKKTCRNENNAKNDGKIKHKEMELEIEKEKGSKSLFFNYINKKKESPYNNILIKKNNQNNNLEKIINSKKHIYRNDTKSEEKYNNDRLNKYYNYALENRLNNTNTDNFKVFSVKKIFNENIKDSSNKRDKSVKSKSYNNNIQIKKKSLNLKMPSLKSNKDYY